MNNLTNRFLWDDCQSIEEQRARIFRRWLAEPLGRYDERWDNRRCLELAIEFMIQPLFMRSTDRRLHEYWSDGIPHFECLSRDLADLRFAGTSVCVAKQNYQGFAPFELDISYAAPDSNVPDALRLRFGERDPSLPIAKIPFGAQPYTKQAAIEVYSRRPRRDQDWAVNLVFDPYRCCVFTQNQKN